MSYPAAPASSVTIGYDAYGRATSVASGVGTETTAYDDGDGVISVTTTYTGLPAQTFTYGYNPDGSRASMDNAGGTWAYSYDAAGRCVAMDSPAGTSTASYLDNGWQASRTLPNGVTTSYAHNAVGALSGLLSQTAGGATLSQYGGMAYDGAFNLTGLTATVPGAAAQSGTTTYAYDAKDRLTGESSTRLGGYAQSHAYDAAGNPTTLRGAGQAFDADNRQTDPNGGAFAYDGNGSPTTYRGQGAAYDPEARLRSLTTAAGPTFTAGYRADGLRAWKASGGSRTYFLYDGGEPVVEMDANGVVLSTNVFAPDGLVARNEPGEGWSQYAFDPEGSVALRLTSDATPRSGLAYDAYGKVVSQAGDPAPEPFGYHAQDGYYQDVETGLYLCQNRYYDPGMGRWATRDPIGANGGINVYGYCAGAPVGNADPSGLIVPPPIPPVPPLIVGAAMAGAAYLGARAGQALDDATGNAYSKTILRLLGQEQPDVLPPDPPLPKKPRRRPDPEYYYRWGSQCESQAELNADVKQTLGTPFPPGVSVFDHPPRDKPYRRAPAKEVEQYFRVPQTGRNPAHHTVVLGYPVSQEATDIWGTLFPSNN